jgi:hypothetical protein
LHSSRNTSDRRASGLRPISSRRTCLGPERPVRHLYPTYENTQFCSTKSADLVTPYKLCEFLTHTFTTSHRCETLTVLQELSLPYNTTKSQSTDYFLKYHIKGSVRVRRLIEWNVSVCLSVTAIMKLRT